MKTEKTRRVGQALAIILGLVGLVVMASCNGDTANKNTMDISPANNQQKIDSGLMLTLQKLEQSQQSQQAIHVLIQTRGEINATQRTALERKGAKIDSVLGDVLTATVPAWLLFEVAHLDFVIHVEMSRPESLR